MTNHKSQQFLVWSTLTITTVIALFPMYWLFTNALTPITATPPLTPILIPAFSLENFQRLLGGTRLYTNWMANSLIVAFAVNTDVLPVTRKMLFCSWGSETCMRRTASGTFISSSWGALLVSPALVAFLGILVERVLIRRLYGRDPLYSLLLTFGLGFMIEDGTRFIWGAHSLPYQIPDWLAAPLSTKYFFLTGYRVFMMILVVAAVLGGRRTVLGAALGAIFLIVAGEFLRPTGELATFIVSAVALLVVLFFPGGFLGAALSREART